MNDDAYQKPDNVEIINMAIKMYDEDDRIDHCRKTLDELSRALCYWQQSHSTDEPEVRQRVAAAIVDLTQIKKILGEKEIDESIMAEINKLQALINAESEREIEIVEGRYSKYSEIYAWANPKGLKCAVGGLAIAEFGNAEIPIIVERVSKKKRGTIKLKYKIVKGTLT